MDSPTEPPSFVHEGLVLDTDLIVLDTHLIVLDTDLIVPQINARLSAGSSGCAVRSLSWGCQDGW